MSRFYVTTPIYYVERRAAHRARVHDGRGRRAHALAPAAAATRSSTSPAPTSTGSRSSARPRRKGSTPAGARRRTVAGVFRDDVGPARHRLRRLHPHHRAAPLHGGAGVPADASTTRATSSSAPTRASTASRARRTTPRTSWSTATARSTTGPVEHVVEENYFFKLSRYERPPARVLRRASRGGAARVAPQRGARLHPRRPAGLLDEPHVDHVGRAAAVGPEARRVRVGRRAVQLLHRGRLRRPTTTASRSGGRSTTTSSARTSCASTRCTGPRC